MNKEEIRQYIFHHLNQAMDDGEIQVYYQPIIRVMTKELCGWEALTRWIKPDGNMVFPGEFIPVLEEERLIYKLDIYMINKVCQDYQNQIAAGQAVEPLSINLSRLDFELCDIFQEIEDAVERYEVPRHMLDIEITETALLMDEDVLHREIQKFRKKGYQVWLDDFGSGYSSFNVIKDYDFDVLKIDMEFLRSFDKNPKVKEIVSTIVEMSKRLGVQTVAEGVETEEQLDFLREIGCEKAQGFYFSKPQPYEMVMETLESRNILMEKLSRRHYMDDISGVDIMSTRFGKAFDEDDNIKQDSNSLGIVEYQDGIVHFLYTNRTLMKALFPLGIRYISEAEDFFNKGVWREKNKAIQTAYQARQDGEEHHLDFVHKGMLFNLYVQHVATNEEERTFAYTIRLYNQSAYLTNDDEDLQTVLRFMYAAYDRIDLFSLAGDFAENVYLNSTQYRGTMIRDNVDECINMLAKSNVYPADQERFIEFYRRDTFEDRILNGNERFLWECFRIIGRKGEYKWQNAMLIPMEYRGKTMFLSCINDVAGDFYQTLEMIYPDQLSGNVNRLTRDLHEASEDANAPDKSITPFNILDNVLDLTGTGIFWKDRERRFLGANRKFLEYYGFESIDSILGKTDEEVGWHIDPDQYVDDEEVVISEGRVIERSPGQCIIQGQVREIEATKKPLYQDGKIVGLIGYFVDVTKRNDYWNPDEERLIKESLDDVSSAQTFHSILARYEDSYWSKGLDFTLMYLELRDFDEYKNSYGDLFVTKLLSRVVKALRKEIGENCVLIRKSENEFLILHQYKQRVEMLELQSRISTALKSVNQIDNIPVDLNVLTGIGFYSETEDPKRMLKIVDSRKNGMSETEF